MRDCLIQHPKSHLYQNFNPSRLLRIWQILYVAPHNKFPYSRICLLCTFLETSRLCISVNTVRVPASQESRIPICSKLTNYVSIRKMQSVCRCDSLCRQDCSHHKEVSVTWYPNHRSILVTGDEHAIGFSSGKRCTFLKTLIAAPSTRNESPWKFQVLTWIVAAAHCLPQCQSHLFW